MSGETFIGKDPNLRAGLASVGTDNSGSCRIQKFTIVEQSRPVLQN